MPTENDEEYPAAEKALWSVPRRTGAAGAGREGVRDMAET